MFYSEGAKVILASRNVQQLEGLKFQLDSEPVKVELLHPLPQFYYLTVTLQQSSGVLRYSPKVIQLDLADSASIAEKCREAVTLFGHIDIVINNAGISSRGSVLDSSTDVDRRVMEVNFFGTVALTKSELDLLSPLHQLMVHSTHRSPPSHAGAGRRTHSCH